MSGHITERFDHDGMFRHHHAAYTGDGYEEGEPIWWGNADRFGGLKRDHRHSPSVAARAAASPVEPCSCEPFFSGHVVEHPDCPRGRAEIAARAAASPVEPKPEWQWTDPEQTNAGPRSPDPVAGLREALNKAARRHHLAAGSPWPFEECQEPWCVEARAALLASDKPGLDVEVLAQMRQRPQFRFAATSDDFAAEYKRLSGGGSDD